MPFRAIVPLALSFAVVFGVNVLPPDTALTDVEALGRLTVCAPRDMAPLSINDPERPGFEIALVEEIARRSDWRVGLTRSIAMQREFNPSNWRITRANCRIMVGGLRNNSWSRSLLELGEPYLSSSWVWMAEPGTPWPPATAGFAPGVFALDRVALGTYLRAEGVSVMPVQNGTELVAAIQSGDAPAGITDSITASSLLNETGLAASSLPGGPDSVGISIGFWKGDTTLRLYFDSVLDDMRSDGTLALLAEQYGLTESLRP